MRRDPMVRWSIACLILATSFTAYSLADEPNKPTASASEKNPATPAAGHSIHGEAFDDGPRHHAELIPNQGKIDFPVSTKNPEAQKFITQGVAQLHTFYYFEAERSFRQAAKLDPGCVMAYWGMAMANVNNAKRAKGFLKEAHAQEKSRPVSRREKLYLDALDALYKDGQTTKTQKANHLLGLEAIVQEFPGDLDARAWLAMVTWQNAASDGIGSRQAVDTLIESILEREPLHPGAIHYRIHLWDGVKPLRAEKAATLYAKAATGIAHAWHMPGHTFTGLKRYNDAAYQQEGSARVDHAAMYRDRIMPCEIHNYSHNNQWLATSLSHVGRAKDAIFVARNLVEQPRDPNKNGPNDGGSSQRSGRARWVELLARYELWDDAIAAIESNALDLGATPQEKTARYHTLGLAYAAKGNATKLAEQIKALKDIAEPASSKSAATKTETPKTETPKAEPAKTAPAAKPADAPKPATTATAKAEPAKPATSATAKVEPAKPAAVAKSDAQAKPATTTTKPPAPAMPGRRGDGAAASALAELEGMQLLAKGDQKGAAEKFAKATSMRDEALARYYLAAKVLDKAEAAARKAVEKQPEQFPPLAQLVEVLNAAGKTKEAQENYRKLEILGRDADRDTPIMKRLAKVTESWATSNGWKPAPETATPETLPLFRHDFEKLGPLGWIPNDAPDFRLVDTEGKPFVLSEHKGRNVVVLFFLGNKCAHCLQQLQVFGKEIKALSDINTDLVAISTDRPEIAKELKNNAEGVKFPMPLLADPDLKLFKEYRAFDDFEDTPVHGTFLIDAKGKVRFQKISAEPFLDVDFIKTEAARVNRLNK